MNFTTESMVMSQINVNFVKSVLGSIHLSPDEVSERCLDLQFGPTLQVPIKSLVLNGLHVIQKMSRPSSVMRWAPSFIGTQDLLSDVVSHVTAEFICDLLRSCLPADPAEECNLLNKLSLVLSSLTRASESATTVLPIREDSHDDSQSTDLEEVDKVAYQGAATDSASELALIVFEDVNLKTMQTCIDKRNRPLMRQHFYEFTKNVPAAIAFCRRGVRCKICFSLYKGPTCVDRLVDHTKAKHPQRASPKHLNQLRNNNSLQKIIGDGMRICRCEMCTYTGPGSLLTHLRQCKPDNASRI